MASWKFWLSKGSAALEDVHSVEQFRRILRRERELADRFGGGFSLLTLAPKTSAGREATLGELAKVLKQRLRSSDEVGWIDPQHGRVGVVMHRTPAPDAWTVADKICQGFPAGVEPPACEVYYYPTNVPQGQLQDAGQVAQADTRPVQGMEVFFIQPSPLWKRSMDVAAAGLALVLLSPLFLIVIVAMKLTSPGPIFFRQYRTGLGGNRFPMYKFRSMRVDAEAVKKELMALNEQDGPAFKITNDPRVTPIGRFLRRTNIDELPQLWNVLNGDMSLVGPRPLPCAEADACTVWQRRRLDVTPGLTCTWQIGGSRDSFDEWVRLDLQYIRSRSPVQDLKLIVGTVPVILFGRRGS